MTNPTRSQLASAQPVELELTGLGAGQFEHAPVANAAPVQHPNNLVHIQLDVEAGQPITNMPILSQLCLGVLLAFDCFGSAIATALFGLVAVVALPVGVWMILYVALMVVSLGLVLATPCCKHKVSFAVVKHLGILMIIAHILIGIYVAALPPMHGADRSGGFYMWPVSLLSFGLAILRSAELLLVARAYRYADFGRCK